MVIGAHPESGFDSEFQMEQLANAKLIAAAPELLEALINLTGKEDYDFNVTPDDFILARKAINKALGE